jgi:hypothetical protein
MPLYFRKRKNWSKVQLEGRKRTGVGKRNKENGGSNSE